MQLMDVCHFSGFQLYIVCGGRWFRITSFEKKISIMVSPPTNFTKHQQTLPNICIQQIPTCSNTKQGSKFQILSFLSFLPFLLRASQNDWVRPGQASPIVLLLLAGYAPGSWWHLDLSAGFRRDAMRPKRCCSHRG
jgi:hypothetical protein